MKFGTKKNPIQKMSTRIYIGRVAGIPKQDLYNLCATFGDLVDFLQKETFAFAVIIYFKKFIY